MSYQIYQTKKAMTFVVTKDAGGAQKAIAALSNELGELRLWKTVPSLQVIGMDPESTVNMSLDEKGYHVQNSEILVDAH